MKWKKLPSLSNRRIEAAGVDLDDERFLVIGGRNGPPDDDNEEKNIFDSGEIYDTNKKSWSHLSDKMPYRRTGCSATNLERKVYIIGDVSKNEEAAKCMDVLDVSKLKFEEGIKMNCSRKYAAIVSSPSNNSLYLFGGLDTPNISERFDVRTKKWEKLPNLPRKRSHCKATRVGKHIYVFGDYNESDTFDVFDVEYCKWVYRDFQPMPGKRKGFTVNTIGDRFIFVCGGRDCNYDTIEYIDIFDTEQKVWTRKNFQMTAARSSHAASVLKKRTFIIAGGIQGNDTIETTEHIPYVSDLDCADKIRVQTLINDNEKGPDLLGLQMATNAIADSIARTDLHTPYTVAVTGNWGSGKSFAKNLIIKDLQKIQEHDFTKIPSNDRIHYPYVGHLYKVEFDSWTYAKSNIWSSLMTEILHQLNAQLDIECQFMNTSVFNTKLPEPKQKSHQEKLSFCKLLRSCDIARDRRNEQNKELKDNLLKIADTIEEFKKKINEENILAETTKEDSPNEKTPLNKNSEKKYVEKLMKVMNNYKLELKEEYEAAYQIIVAMMEIYEGPALKWIQILFSILQSFHDVIEHKLLNEKWMNIIVELEKSEKPTERNVDMKSKELRRKENELTNKTIEEAKTHIDKCKRMIEIDIIGFSEAMEKVIKTTESWYSERSTKKIDLKNGLDTLEKNLDTLIESCDDEADVFESMKTDLIFFKTQYEHGMAVSPDSLQKCYEKVENYVEMKGRPLLLERGVSTWRIINDFSSIDIEYLKKKVKDYPNLFNVLKEKNHANVSKALADLLKDTYESDRNELKKKENKLKRLVWENAVDENRNNRLSQMLDYVYNAHRKKYPENSVPTSFDIIWNDLDIFSKLYLRWRSLNVLCCLMLLLLYIVIYSIFLISSNIISEKIKQSMLVRVIAILGPLSTALHVFERRFSKLYDDMKDSVDIAFKYAYKNSQQDLEAQSEKNLRIQQVSKEIKELRNQIWLKEGDTLKGTIDARLKETGSYEEDLQIVHRVQKDLKIFSEALFSPNNKKKLPRGKPRIFLFIDDLDRCSPGRVVQTLEAIKLLLRSPIFVVILTADMRYLTRSIEQHVDFKNILKRNSCLSGQEYIEKIVQITFHVPQVNFETMKLYLKNKIEVEDEDENKERNLARSDTIEFPGNTMHNSRKTWSFSTQIHRNISETSSNYDFVPQDYERKVKCSEKELNVFHEVCYAARISPRCANRVTNSYKLLKFIWRKIYVSNLDEKVCYACIALLGLCAASTLEVRLDLQKAFSWLERGMRDKKGDFNTYLKSHIFSNDSQWPMECVEISKKYLSLSWNDFEKDFWRARCFACVGDLE